MLVVVTIIMVLTAAGIVTYSNATKRSHDARRTSDVEQMRQALEMYRSDNGTYPVNINALIPSYIAVLPTDPRYNATEPYSYQAANSNYGYCVCARMEATTAVNNCAAAPISLGYPTANYTYCMRSP